MRALITFSIWLLAAAPGVAQDVVVLAAERSGRIEFYSPTLVKFGDIRAQGQLESVTAGRDGTRLYVARKDVVLRKARLNSAAMKSDSSTGKIYNLYSFDLRSQSMCFLTAPALFGWPSADGRYLFTQAKNGVDVFDARTLNRLSTMQGRGAYNLQPSPDGRWLLGIANSPDSSLDIFDMNSPSRVRGIPLEGGPFTGAWAGDHFYLFNYTRSGTGHLWSVNPEAAEASHTKSINLPDIFGGCNEPVPLILAGAPGRLVLAEAFGFSVDRRGACPNSARDGVYVIRPSSGSVTHIAESVRVHRMAVSADGQDLYVIHSSDVNAPYNFHLLHIETATGRVVQDVALQGSDWNLALARIPSDLVPHGSLQAMSYCSH